MNIPDNSSGKKGNQAIPADASGELPRTSAPPGDIQPQPVPAVRAPRRLFAANSLVPSVLRALMVVLVVIALSALVFSLNGLLLSWKVSVQPEFVDYTLVILLGMLVGFIEIISRYQDAPFRTALAWPSLFYMLINGLVAGTALGLVNIFHWDFTPGVTDESIKRWSGVLIAGLGAMSIFRSAVFVVGKEDKQVSVGPNAVLEVLLNAIDKEVDRYRGQERASSVRTIMQNIHYEDAISDLTVFSGALMQNLSNEDQERVSISKLRSLIEGATNDNDVRKYLLGLRIMDVVGEDILSQAIGIRGEDYYRQAAKKRAAEVAKQDQVAQLLREKLEEAKARLPQSTETPTVSVPSNPPPESRPASAESESTFLVTESAVQAEPPALLVDRPRQPVPNAEGAQPKVDS